MTPPPTAPIAWSAGVDLDAALDQALAADLDAITALERGIRSAQAEQLRLVARARERAELLEGVHDGSSTTERELATRAFVAELATTLVVHEVRASAMVGEAARLAELPATAAAFAAGDLGLAQVRTILEVTTGASPEVTARIEREAIDRAAHQTNASLRRSLRRLRERLEPVPLVERREAAANERRVCVEPAPDGMAWFGILMEAERAIAVQARLDAIIARAEGEASDLAAARAGGTDQRSCDPRTRDQRRADLAGDLLLAGTLAAGGFAALTATGVVAPRILVTVPVLSLLGATDEPAELDGYGPIDAETARRLAAHAPSFQRILTHPETGAFLSYGRTTYRVPADLAGYLQVRDGGCRFPGCGRRARDTDLDHTRDWAHGGDTSHENLACLCRKHHRLKHRSRWRMTQEPGGVIRWTSPAGHVLRTHPQRPFLAVPANAGCRTDGTVGGASTADAPPWAA
ncbi:DUF222 domain-containing protein [Agromyces sp. MMS24-K17]|uniref:HNH endonuclease signature motif containing protein n=1 Tax=Agromyces sp. MMS24-K17 TaxID=3372850 RepID=UPI003755012B